MPNFHGFAIGASLVNINQDFADVILLILFKIYVLCSLVLNEKTTAKLNSALPFTALNLQWTDVLLSMIWSLYL